MLILSEMIRTGRLGVKDSGKNLRNVGAEMRVLVRVCLLLVFLLGGPLASGDSRVECGGCVLRTQVPAGDGDAGLMIDEDLVMRVSAIGGRVDDLDAVALQPGNQRGQARVLLVQRQVDAGFDADKKLFPMDPAFHTSFFQLFLGGPAGQLGGQDRRTDAVAMVVQGDIIEAVVPMGFAAGGAGFGRDIVRAKDGVVFGQIGEMIVFYDGGGDAVDALGDRLGRGGIELWGRFGNRENPVLPAAGWDQMELLLDGFAGRLGQFGAHAMGVDVA